jgi:hypothetical protein
MNIDDNSTLLSETLHLTCSVLRSLGEASKFIKQLSRKHDGEVHWLLAGSSLEAAHKNPNCSDQLRLATAALRNALRTEGLLSPHMPDVSAMPQSSNNA